MNLNRELVKHMTQAGGSHQHHGVVMTAKEVAGRVLGEARRSLQVAVD